MPRFGCVGDFILCPAVLEAEAARDKRQVTIECLRLTPHVTTYENFRFTIQSSSTNFPVNRQVASEKEKIFKLSDTLLTKEFYEVITRHCE